MSTLIGYNDRIWEPVMEFTYTGECESFSLDPGKYLFICHGGNGGKGKQNYQIYYGGSTYGILNIEETSNFYAVVGGNGEDAVMGLNVISKGGFNGGGDGSPQQISASTYNGAGGGGATDIRLFPPDTIESYTQTFDQSSIPSDEYTPVEYIQNTGNSYINTGYVHNPNTKIECVCEVTETTSKTTCVLFGSRYDTNSSNMLFLTRYNNDKYPAISCSNITTTSDTEMTYDEKIKVVMYENKATWYDMEDNILGEVEIPSTVKQVQGNTPLWIFNSNKNNTSENMNCNAKLYSFKIFEDNELKHFFLPVKNNQSSGGLYDVIDGEFHQQSSTMSYGDELTEFSYEIESSYDKSLLSRIMVAGGGGGGANLAYSANGNNYSGYGGSITSCKLISSQSTDASRNKYASQTSGFLFGKGMDGIPRTSSTSSEGAGGGGGGWFGGYSANSYGNISNTNIGGCGGSGYVLTEESYKPSHYTDTVDCEKYCFDHTVMTSMVSSSEPKIQICKTTNVIFENDVIIYPCIGKCEKVTLPLGVFKLKCWGGDGGVRYNINSTARGGYVEGVLTTTDKNTDLFITVGGSGITPTEDNTLVYTHRPTVAFNGGGSRGTNDVKSTFGGGATDIRLKRVDENINESESLLSRIIVAGGAGGHGAAETSGNRFGGEGGGYSGNNPSNTRNGTVPGPGTQTSSPANDRVGGGFGYGGSGVFANNGYGGAGGGGWFGGSGCIPDVSNDDDRGGCGGSGYVLTEESYKPEGYLEGIDDISKYYLTDTVLTTGGNNLLYGYTKAEIQVIQALYTRILCHDAEGYKYYDTENSSWVFLKTETPAIEDYGEYGVYEIISDEGLLSEYQIIIYDEYGVIGNNVSMYITPNQQRITMTTESNFDINNYVLDMDYNKSEFDVDFNTSKRGNGEDSVTLINVYIDKKSSGDLSNKLYALYVESFNEHKGGYRYIEPKEEYVPLTPSDPDYVKKYLLPVSSQKNTPVRYMDYLTTISGSNVTTINTSVCCEYGRNIYIAIAINTSTVRLMKINLFTSRTTIIRDIPKTLIGNYWYGGLLVDENYAYLTCSYNNNNSVAGRSLYRINLNNPDEITTFTISNNSTNNITAYGKMTWIDEHTIAICIMSGLAFFDTIDESFTLQPVTFSSSARRDFAIGEKYGIFVSEGNNVGAIIWDKINNTTKSLKDDFGISFTASALNSVCYNEGYFYIAQTNMLMILDEDLNIVKNIPVPWTVPSTLYCTNGIVYATCNNSNRFWYYNISKNKFDSKILDWTIPALSATALIRPCVFNGYIFIPYWRFGYANMISESKYNIGKKYNKYSYLFNEQTEADCVYDNRFISFRNGYVTMHDGYIIYPTISNEDMIKIVEVNKSDYKKFIKLNIRS